MKRLLFLANLMFLSIPALSEEIPGVTYSIRPDPYVSSDQVSICRVVVWNQSGRTLDGRLLTFEATALENGVAIVHERGRFGGIVRSGETSETLIGFTGAFRDFTVLPAEGSGARPHSARRPKTTAKLPAGSRKAPRKAGRRRQ